MKFTFFILLSCFIIACQGEPEDLTADQIVERAIEKAGGERYETAEIDFVFRKNLYTSKREEGIYEFTRTRTDSIGKVKDILNNEGVKRLREGQEVRLVDSVATAVGESVNSVHYFVQLPFGLDGEAVQKELVGTDSIRGKAYYEIKVTFRQEGGGADHEDIYMYWIQKEDYTVDYLAYRFFINEGGIRFRVAVNPRVVNGIRFVDYENYKTEQLDTPLEQLDELYLAGELEKVSQIENEILKVELQ